LKLFTFTFDRGKHTSRTIAMAAVAETNNLATFDRWQQYIVDRPAMKLLMELVGLMKINGKREIKWIRSIGLD